MKVYFIMFRLKGAKRYEHLSTRFCTRSEIIAELEQLRRDNPNHEFCTRERKNEHEA